MVRRLDISEADLYRNLLRDASTPTKQLGSALTALGTEIGRAVVSEFSVETTITTPMNQRFRGRVPRVPDAVVVITTKIDAPYLGHAIAHRLNGCPIGYLDFGDARGQAALTAPIRSAKFPDGRADLIVIAKTTLATGCTAISLAKNAIQKYNPSRVMVFGLFYSPQAVQEIEKSLPQVDITVFGAPDQIAGDNLLVPGVGLIDRRLPNVPWSDLGTIPLFSTDVQTAIVVPPPSEEVAAAIRARVVSLCDHVETEGLTVTRTELVDLVTHYERSLVAARSHGAGTPLDVAQGITEVSLKEVLIRLRRSRSK